MPHMEAGKRIEPPMSLPCATGTKPAATAAAEPEGLTPLLARILRNIGEAQSQRQLGHALGVGPAQISVATSERRPRSSNTALTFSNVMPVSRPCSCRNAFGTR